MIEDYVTVYPTWPDAMASNVGRVDMTVAMALPDVSSNLVIRVSVQTESVDGADRMVVVLDFDVFRTDHLPSVGCDVFETLNAMKEKQRDTFEQCITNKARALFQ